MTTEQWAPAPGYEGIYEVSDLGRVRSLDRIDARGHRRKGVHLTPGDSNGRPTVSLCRGGACRTYQVGQLVLLAFAGPRPDGMHACHWNDDPTDNRLTNLRWDTPSANSLDGVRNGVHPKARVTRCPKGHFYTAENTYSHPSGRRVCRECRRTNNRLRLAKKEGQLT